MSSYEDYTRASAEYDQTRVAVGEEIVLGALTKGRVPLRRARLLDAGCGTGSYAAAVEARVGSLTLLDASEDMLLRAREKLVDADGAEFHQGWLQQLPFDDSSFDAVMTNQVLHHIGDDDGGSWTEHQKVFAEYGRVLRPGGVLVVNTCSQLQLRHGYWYYTLIPAAVEVLRRQYAPLSVIERLAAQNELTVTGSFVPVGATIQGSAYFDGAGPLSASWRLGDSTWSLADEEELAAATEKVAALREKDELENFVAEHDARRDSIGQITFVVARFPA
jgi:ubiquinone/menaquinone biosynthesis C-methylase UbiE